MVSQLGVDDLGDFCILPKLKAVRIPSKLYYDMYCRGGDKLIAVFCHLKAGRGKDIKYYAHTAKNNKVVQHYSLLRKETNISLHTLKKYVPVLIDMGLVVFEPKGDVAIKGTNSLIKQYNKKLVPIILGEKITDTQYYVFSVRIHANEGNQKLMIAKKTLQKEQILQYINKNPKDLPTYKKGAYLFRKLDGRIPLINDKVVLSNHGFGSLKNSGTSDDEHNKNFWRGQYAKKQLKKRKIIATQRSFTQLKEMSRKEYEMWRIFNSEKKEYSFFVYRNGHVCKENISTFYTIDNFTGSKGMQ